MVDIHCHILPGLDDGPAEMDESLRMAEAAIADGITHVVATPHSSGDYTFDYARVRQLRDELQARIGKRLTLATGCDFHMSVENVVALRADAARFCINQHKYLLVEFSEFSIPPSTDRALHEMQLMDIRPVVTHPERNAIALARPARLVEWVRLGCYVQVTAGAITGGFGAGPKAAALRWIGQGLVHFVASDAHNTRRRPLKLGAAYDAVAHRYGEQKAEALFVENPKAAFEGRDLPHVPEVVREDQVRKKKRFLFF